MRTLNRCGSAPSTEMSSGARPVVFGDDDDVGQRCAVLLLEGRAREGGQHHKTRQTAQGPAAETAHQGKANTAHHDNREHREDRPWQQRVE